MSQLKQKAGTLRKVDAEAASGGWVNGGMVDESFPAPAVRAALENVGAQIDVEAFFAFLGPRLGRYRACETDARSRPSVGSELALIEDLMEAIDQTQTRLKNLPPHADAAINMICHKRHGEFFFDYARNLSRQLREAWTMLVLAERELEPHGGKAGRKPSRNRDSLLYDVAAKIEASGLTKEAAAECAASVLRACRVPAPDGHEGPKEAARIIRAWGAEIAGEK